MSASAAVQICEKRRAKGVAIRFIGMPLFRTTRSRERSRSNGLRAGGMQRILTIKHLIIRLLSIFVDVNWKVHAPCRHTGIDSYAALRQWELSGRRSAPAA